MTVDPDNPYRLVGDFTVQVDGDLRHQVRDQGRQAQPAPGRPPDQGPARSAASRLNSSDPSRSSRSPATASWRSASRRPTTTASRTRCCTSTRTRRFSSRPRIIWSRRNRRSSWFEDDVIDLEALRVRPGTKVEYWLTVRRHDANRSRTGSRPCARSSRWSIPCHLKRFASSARAGPGPPGAGAESRRPGSARRERRRERPGRAKRRANTRPGRWQPSQGGEGNPQDQGQDQGGQNPPPDAQASDGRR